MVEITAVRAFLHEGHIVIFLHLSEFLTELWCQHRPFGFHLQITVVVDHPVKDGLIDQAQHFILSRCPTLQDSLDSRFQRVGCNHTHHLSCIQFGFQQLTVGILFLSLSYNLLQHFILGLRQVFLFCLNSLFPKFSV